MLAIITLILALAFIWAAWGFWAFLGAFLGSIFIGMLTKPRYEWDTNWGVWVCGAIVRIVGICAVNAIWHEPAYNIGAVILVILSFVI